MRPRRRPAPAGALRLAPAPAVAARVCLVLLVVLVLLVLVPVTEVLAAEAPAEHAPRYVERLDLPVETDRILSPRSVAADLHTGEVFVTDLHRDRVVIFGPDGAFRFQIRGGDVFRAPRDVAVDPEGFLYLAANRGTEDVLLKLDFDGQPVGEVLLTGLEEAVEGELEPPRLVSLALSPEGDRLYLLDEANKRLWLATTEGRITGSVDLGEGLAENKVRDLQLGHVDVYGDQVLVAMASLGEIHLFGLEGDRRGHVGFYGTAPCQLAFPVAAARDAGGDYLVVDQQRVLISRWSPVGNRCIGEYFGLGSDPGYLYFPFDLALGPPGDGGVLDTGGDLYVSQGYEGRVQAYSVAEPAALPEDEDEDGEQDEDGEAGEDGETGEDGGSRQGR